MYHEVKTHSNSLNKCLLLAYMSRVNKPKIITYNNKKLMAHNLPNNSILKSQSCDIYVMTPANHIPVMTNNTFIFSLSMYIYVCIYRKIERVCVISITLYHNISICLIRTKLIITNLYIFYLNRM